jgi:hypothetical protein
MDYTVGMWTPTPPHHDWPRADPLTPYVDPGDERPRRRAARLLWITGTVLCVVFGSCAGWMWVLDGFSPEEVERFLRRSQAEDVDALMNQYHQIAPYLGALAMTLLVLGFLPGLAYLLLGFPVRRGRRPATVIAFVLIGMQTLVVGLMCLLNLLGALIAGNPGGATMAVLMWGSLLALLIYTAWWLLQALRGHPAPLTADPPDGREPWDRW